MQTATIAKITYLDSTRLYRAIVAGIREVVADQEHLNKINVFPVPDGDTGTNMALTLSAIIDGTYNHQTKKINDYLDLVANCALDGARGNSGTIFAQFFVGFSEGARSIENKMTTNNFVAAISSASNHAHKALSEPKEGTILTVIRDFCDEITQQMSNHMEKDFSSLMEQGLKRAQTSLANTTQQLKALKKANVVDAGAQGFINFLQGIQNFISTGSIRALDEVNDTLVITDTPVLEHGINEKYQFCTECLITGQDINHHHLREELESLGDCVIVAGSPRKAKIHLHTNEPQRAFHICRDFGDTQKEKADDMLHQQQSIMNKNKQVAIITDSSADFDDDVVSDLNIHVVPLSIHLNNTNYLDKVTITSDEFFQLLRHSDDTPKTSQPSGGELKRQYQYLASHYDAIIAMHLPAALSGTLNASQAAAAKIDSENITVMDCYNTSGGQGLLVQLAARAAQQGQSREAIIKLIEAARPLTQVFVIMHDLTAVTRSGRLPKALKTVFDLFHLRPILSFNDIGKGIVRGIARPKRSVAKSLMKFVRKRVDRKKRYHIQVLHADNPSEADTLKQQLASTLSQQIASITSTHCAAAIACHTGLGSVGVAIQEVIDLPESPSS